MYQIFTYTWLKFNYGECRLAIPYMEHMGMCLYIVYSIYNIYIYILYIYIKYHQNTQGLRAIPPPKKNPSNLSARISIFGEGLPAAIYLVKL